MKKGIGEIDGALIIAGTCVGAGILALPVALFELGLAGSTLLILLLGGLNILTALFLVEIILRTKGKTHLPSLADMYLGRAASFAMIGSLALCIYGAVVGYLISGGVVLEELSSGAVPAWLGMLAYFCVATFIVWAGMWWLENAEKAFFTVMLAFSVLILLAALPFVKLEDGFVSLSSLPLAFGVTLFALAVHAVIPTVGNAMKGNPRGFAKAVAGGLFLPIGLYLAWTFIISAALPDEMLQAARLRGEPATIPLGEFVGFGVVIAGSVFALFSTFTSFIGTAYSLADAFQDAFRELLHRVLKRGAAVLLVVLPSLVIAVLNPHGFLQALELAGFYGVGIFIGILIPLIYIAARRSRGRTPEFSIPFGSALAALTLVFFSAALVWKTWLLVSGS